MKKLLLFVLVITALAACNTATPPKETAQQFISAVYSGNSQEAAALATEGTKAAIADTKASTPAAPAAESFSFATLTETISGSTATVKNDLITLTLEKDSDGWKVAATPGLVASISNRQEDLAALKNKWEALEKEYEARLKLADEYVKYKKGQGALSPHLQTLGEMIKTLSVKTVWDKEKILLYAQRQQQLADLVDKALEPSYTANTDLSMNYFLQLSNAGDRIEAVQAEYQLLAEKTPSATYPPLPFKTASATKGN